MPTAVYPSMTPSANDSLQILLVKATYWAESAAGAGPFSTGMFTNMSAAASDTLQILAAKLAYWLQQIDAGGGGGGGGLAFSSAAGADPNGAVSGSPGDTYYSTTTGTLWTKVSGVATTSGWVV